MKNASKHILLLLSIAAVISSCHKDNSTTPAQSHIDFRDSLVGSYSCTTIHSYSSPGGSTADTVADTVMVTKSAGTDSSIAVGGSTFSFASAGNGGVRFNGPVQNSTSCQNLVSMATNGSGIYWLNECQTVSTGTSTITQGNRIR